MPLTQSELIQSYQEFPEVSYEDFRKLPPLIRRQIIERNRVINTDTYNRSMTFYKGDQWRAPETYVLQMRKTADQNYLITYGIRRALERVFGSPITKNEIDFAAEYYKTTNVKHFNEKMWREVVENHHGWVPLDIKALEDGTAILAGDPVLRVSGPGELAAHFEPDFHRIFYPTLVATTAQRIDAAIGGERFIEVGKRGTPNEEMHLEAAEAMYAGGGIRLTSNDAAAAVYDELKDVGTMGHRYVQFKNTELEAFEEAIQCSEAVTLLIDLVDSMKGIDKALMLKQKYRSSGKKIWIRLDSGDLIKQTLYVLSRYKELGFTDAVLDKVVIEDLNDVDDIEKIEALVKNAGYNPKKYLIYGAGSLLVTKNKERSQASTGYKLCAVGDKPKMKFSDSEGKESLPGQPDLVEIGSDKRLIAQVGEFPMGKSLLVPAYREGNILLEDDLEAVRRRVKSSLQHLENQMPFVGIQKNGVFRTPLSPRTLEMKQNLRMQYAA